MPNTNIAHSPIVFFHAGCPDGFGAAWSAYMHHFDAAEYVPSVYGMTPPDVSGRSVYVLDFSFPVDVVRQMRDQAASFILLDHHRTAFDELAGEPGCYFDMKRSGALLAWRHFHEDDADRPPQLLRYIEDRDLWRFRLPGSRAVNAYLGTLPFRPSSRTSQSEILAAFESFTKLIEQPLDVVVEHGNTALRVVDQYVQSMVSRARIETMEGIGFVLINAPGFAISELLGELAEIRGEVDFAVGWTMLADGTILYSLRSSVNNGNYDVSEVAKRMKGGGHRNAAGFKTNMLPGVELYSRMLGL